MAVDAQSILTDDHSELDHLLSETFNAIENSDVDNTFQRLDLFWARLAMHIRAEHLRLFPAVLDLSSKTERELPSDLEQIIDELHSDHDFFMHELARAIKAMRLVFYFGNEEQTLLVVSQLLESIRERLAEHNRVEEEIVYPLVSEILLGHDAANKLTKAVRQEIERLPPRFHPTTK